MSVYVSSWDEQLPLATVTVHEEPKAFRVTYRGAKRNFRVVVHQKPNPIGFRARLPGDKK